MEILGIGPLELFFILLIALIVLGPGDMVKAGRTLGRFLRKVVTSPEWRTVQKASRLMREANLEDLSKDLSDINKIGGQISSDVKKMEIDFTSWTTPPELAGDKLHPRDPDESQSINPNPTDNPERPIEHA
jgi:Sec-independent protein translocase protein TatA